MMIFSYLLLRAVWFSFVLLYFGLLVNITMNNIDVELLISLVEARPDKSLELYKDRNLTKKAWEEMWNKLKSHFNELQDKE